MHKRNDKRFIRLMAMLLALVLVLPVGIRTAKAEAIQPRASDYLDSYNGYVYPAGNGKIQVWFTVTGNNDMDSLGCLRLSIYESTDNENWIWVKNYTNTTNPDFLAYDDFFHTSHVEYQGVAGRYYKAYFCIWAGDGDNGDTRYFYSSAKLAT